MKSAARPIRAGGFALPDPDRAGFRYPVPSQVEVEERAGIAVLVFGSTYVGPDQEQVKSPPLRDCLDPFVRLADADDQSFLEYAHTWGSLDLCLHLVPWLHSPRCGPLKVEPVEAWRFYARKLRAFRTVAAALRANAAPDPEAGRWIQAWPRPLSMAEAEAIEGSVLRESLRERSPYGTYPSEFWTPRRALKLELGREPSDQELARAYEPALVAFNLRMNWDLVASEATKLLDFGGVHPRVYGHGAPRAESPLFLAFGWSGLSGALAICLADELAHGGLYVCDLCHLPFSTRRRRRQPSQADPNIYCGECSRGNHKAVKRAWAHEAYWDTHQPQRRSPTHPHGSKGPR